MISRVSEFELKHGPFSIFILNWRWISGICVSDRKESITCSQICYYTEERVIGNWNYLPCENMPLYTGIRYTLVYRWIAQPMPIHRCVPCLRVPIYSTYNIKCGTSGFGQNQFSFIATHSVNRKLYNHVENIRIYGSGCDIVRILSVWCSIQMLCASWVYDEYVTGWRGYLLCQPEVQVIPVCHQKDFPECPHTIKWNCEYSM